MNLTKTDLDGLERKFKLNLINSITGIKPANLIGTKSEKGNENLAIFSSVIHLGSNPAYIGFILRPTGEIPRNTYENIKNTSYYTINSVPLNLAKNAHYTSAKFNQEVNEFDRCNIKSEYINDFYAPFVSESKIKIGLRIQDQIPIELNGTTLIVGSVEQLHISQEIVNKNGYVNLDEAQVAGISGLNSYYDLTLKNQFPYVRTDEVPEF